VLLVLLVCGISSTRVVVVFLKKNLEEFFHFSTPHTRIVSIIIAEDMIYEI
jgi:hypothetical protein